jgi:hypothetical protein
VLYLTQYETEITLQLLDFRPKILVIRTLRLCLQLEHLFSSVAELLALVELAFEEKMIGEILQGKRISGVGLEGFIK